jgi:tetratricopeptide (TPR) repeat protein
MSQSEDFQARFHYERGEALGRQGAYKAAIKEFEEALKYSPPPELEMAIYYDLAISIQKQYRLHDTLTFQIDEEEAKQAARIIELCDRAMHIYHTKFETGKVITHLPVRQVYERAENLKLRTQLLRPKKKGGCFIATAVYGSDAAYEVEILRRFRDEKLLYHSLGKAFIKAYYTVSPSIAYFIGKYEFLRWLIKVVVVQPMFILAAFSCKNLRK